MRACASLTPLSRPTSSAAPEGRSRPAIGVAVGRQEDGEQSFSPALLDAAKALSIAQAILAAVGQVISTDNVDGVVAEAMEGVDIDAELAKLLDGGQ